jgi:hypothetical protein
MDRLRLVHAGYSKDTVQHHENMYIGMDRLSGRLKLLLKVMVSVKVTEIMSFRWQEFRSNSGWTETIGPDV